jgi:hypothetical protein
LTMAGTFESGTGVPHSKTQACLKPGEPPMQPSQNVSAFFKRWGF